jgi:para-aminobenzoate synthetase / 4-amino-4-deoxychorismate lyase
LTVLERRDVPFDLLETLRWTPEESFFLLERHLDRLQQSARFFGYRCEITGLRSALDAAVASAASALRIRVLVSRDGAVRVEQQPLQQTADPLRVALATRPVDPSNPFLFHKTTNRGEQERERTPAFDEIILWNPDRDVTEAMTANVVASLDGRLVTPPVSCGLLAGTMRAELLAAGAIEEARIPVDRLADAPSFWLINSVRGWRRAVLARR